MKKTISICLLTVFVLSALFSTIYYVSYKNFSEEHNTLLQETEPFEEYTVFDAVEAEAVGDIHISRRMTYIHELYDEENDILSNTVEPVPDEWMGLSREMLVEKFAEENKGLSLISFAEDRLVVREKIISESKKNGYYLVVKDGMLVVYDNETGEVFLNTYLTVGELPDEYREMLENGFYIEDISVLYNYLETITS